jgi:uncharacterized protein YhaN
MAANEYVQAAAAQLQSAATAIKGEIDQIHGELMTFDRQVTHEITSKEAKMRSDSVLASTSPDPEQARLMLAHVQREKSEIDNLKRSLEQRKTQVNQAIRAKEGAMNGLMSQARSLQNQAGSLK